METKLEAIGSALLRFLSKSETQVKIAEAIAPFVQTYELLKRARNGKALMNAFFLGWSSLTPEEQSSVIDISVIDFGRAFDHMKTHSTNICSWIDGVRKGPVVYFQFMTEVELAQWYAINKRQYDKALNEVINKTITLKDSVSHA